jgi:uncharacterized protein YrrD
MRSANELLGKPVIDQATGERLTSVNDAVFSADGRAIVARLSSGGLLSSPLVLRWNTIVSIGDVIVRQGSTPLPSLGDDEEISALAKQTYHFTGTKIITSSGAEIGEVGDVFIDDRGIVVGYEVKQGLFAGRKFLSVARAQTIGKDAIIASVNDASELQSLSEIERELGS